MATTADRTRAALRAEVFLDVSCPWCHGALPTVRRLLDEIAADPAMPAVDVTLRFIRLHDLDPPGGYPVADMYARYGMDEQRAAAAQASLAEYLASTGTRLDDERFRFVHNPLLAHRLLAMVRDDPGTDTPDMWTLMRAVWSANFVGGVAIDDPDALRAAVRATGIEVPERFWTRLRDPEDHLAETLADRARALEASLDGVPRFFVNGAIIPAWVPIGEVRELLHAAIRRDT